MANDKYSFVIKKKNKKVLIQSCPLVNNSPEHRLKAEPTAGEVTQHKMRFHIRFEFAWGIVFSASTAELKEEIQILSQIIKIKLQFL